MSQTESPPQTLADTIELSEELREEGRIDGQVKLYNIDKEDEFESDAEKFFKRTVPTQGLHETLSILRDSLNGADPRQTHILYGPYGSGKSHQMVALYHCFSEPAIAGEWASDHVDGLQEALPADPTAITVSMQYENNDYDYLWEPFFEGLDHEVGSFESGGYPDVQTIERAVGDKTVAFIVDELEDWFDTLDDNLESANRAFLQSLMEATAMDSLDLFTVVSVLRKGSAVHNILDREDAVQMNMNSKVSKRDVLLHRLIGDVDEEKASDIIEGYLEAYDRSDYVEDGAVTSEEMLDLYPLHPELVETLEDRYYENDSNQNTRGMIYLFSTVLLELQDETDLITHADIDAERFEDELSKINFERPSACVADIKSRVRDELEYGRRILNSILLYSLNDSQGEGAEVSQIVMGTYQTGDRVSDIYIQLEQLHGVAWHLHKLNGKYAIRDKRNPNALIRNAAGDVSEVAAKGEIADVIQEIFGSGAYTLGFRSDDIRDIPDSKQTKVIIKDTEWTLEEVRNVITDEGRGRKWRNTFVFVQPNEGEAIESGTRYIDKARYIEGARQVLADDGLDDSIRSRIEAMKSQEEDELRKELRQTYGDVIDGDDLLNEFEMAEPMALDVFVLDGDEYSARTIGEEAAADRFDLSDHVWPITEDLLSRKGETTMEAVYEEFLRDPKYPIPGSVGDVIDAANKEGGLSGKPVLLHTKEDGFSESLDELTPKTTIIHEDPVETWDISKVEDDLRTRFSEGETEISIGEYYENLVSKTDVRIDGDERDTLFMAIGRLTSDAVYIIARGAELLNEPKLDATIRDVSGAEVIGTTEIVERIHAAVETDGRAKMDQVIREIRIDEDVYLPADDTDAAVREAVNNCLADDYLLEAGRRYHSELGDRDPAAATIVPTVSSRVAEEILDHIGSLDPDTSFTVSSVQGRFGSDVAAAAVRTFLLQHLGTEEEPEYVISNNGSTDPSQWMNGYPFRTPAKEGHNTWRFEYQGEDATDLRSKWRSEHETGVLEYGSLRFVLSGSSGVPTNMQGAADTDRALVDLTLESGQEYTAISKLFDKLSDDATDIRVEMEFKKD